MKGLVVFKGVNPRRPWDDLWLTSRGQRTGSPKLSCGTWGGRGRWLRGPPRSAWPRLGMSETGSPALLSGDLGQGREAPSGHWGDRVTMQAGQGHREGGGGVFCPPHTKNVTLATTYRARAAAGRLPVPTGSEGLWKGGSRTTRSRGVRGNR